MLIGYARVSTEDQDAALQIQALKLAGCERFYVDRKSGKDMDRPEWRKCRADLRQDDTLIVWKLDRLGRNAIDVLQTIKDLKDEDIGLKSITEALDSSTAIGMFVITIMAGFAEMERNMISERTKAGADAAKARGVKLGGVPRMANPKIWKAAQDAIAEWPKDQGDPSNNYIATEIRARTGENIVTATVRNNRETVLSGVMPEDWEERWKQYAAKEKARKGKTR